MSSVRGIFLKISALLLFTVMAAMIKAAVAVVPAGQAVFFRAFCALPVILLWLRWRGELATGLRTRHPWLHLWRGTIGGLSMGLTFVALGLLPLPEVTVVGFVTPILTLVLSVLMLGETVRLFRWSMVLLGLVGVVIVVSPRLSLEGAADRLALWGLLAATISAGLRSLVQIHVRRMVKTENPATIVFYFAVIVSLGGLATAPFGWVMPDAKVWALMIGAGVLGSVAQLMVTSAVRQAEPSVLAPFDYVSILFSMLVGFVVFGDVPTGAMWAGASLVILSGVLIVLRERQLGLKKPREPQTP
jgi:drug/metabolite transporter (DMT)-like permease